MTLRNRETFVLHVIRGRNDVEKRIVKNFPEIYSIEGEDFSEEVINKMPYDVLRQKKENVLLLGSSEGDIAEEALRILGEENREGFPKVLIKGDIFPFMSWFFQLGDNDYSVRNPKLVKLWFTHVKNWLNEISGGNVLKAIGTNNPKRKPSVIFLVRGSSLANLENLNFNSKTRDYAETLKNSYRDYLETRGLKSKDVKIKPSYEAIKEYYSLIKKIETDNIIERPYHNFDFLSKKIEAKSRINQSAIEEILIESLDYIYKSRYHKLNKSLKYMLIEMDRLNNDFEDGKFRIEREKKKVEYFKREADIIRDIDLGEVITKLYGGEESSKNSKTGKIFVISGEREIDVNLEDWTDLKDNVKGRGAIELIRHLSGYPDGDDIFPMIRELLSTFPEEAVCRSANFKYSQDEEYLKSMFKNAKYEPPAASEKHWKEARSYLLKIRINRQIIDLCHRMGLIKTDRHGSILFVCDKESGVFLLPTKGPYDASKFQNPLKDSLPFFLEGLEDRVILTDNPIEALRCKESDPLASVISLGCESELSILREYLNDKEIIFSCREGTKFSKKLHRYLKNNYVKARF
jgi:hypothetical protein